MLIELEETFTKKFGVMPSTAAPNSMSNSASSIMKTICKKYDDPANVDKTKELLGKVEEVKGTMADNIAMILENTDKVEDLAEKSTVLTDQATEFQKKSKQLKKNMWWKDMKMTLLVGLVVCLLLLVILWPILSKVGSSDKDDS
mmetsp:Transcript_9811/g.21855  ORF Transcript_9811/g.21855 Transcript_9811/m.21855 type:complete len:144 (+) Transcript_9811:758-1189(+)